MNNSEIQALALQQKEDLARKLEWLKANFKVVDDQSAAHADYLIGIFAEKLKAIEAKEKPLTSATYKAWQEALNIFREPKKFCDEIVRFFKDQIGQYTIWRNQMQQQALQAATQQGEAVAQEALVETPELELNNVSTTTTYSFRVVNAALVPDRFCVKTVNLRLVELAVDEGVREIPGIEIYPSTNVRRKARRT